jgi:cysteine desulfurase / selenocysteine lyase
MDLAALRNSFPALTRQTYLNHAGVAPTSLRVARAVSEWVDDLVQFGVKNEHRWEERANEVRALCGRLISAQADEIAFVRNTSHGLGLIAEGLSWSTGDEVAVCTALEYPSNVYPWLHLRDRGVVVREIEPHNDGVTPEAVERAISDRTRLVAVSSVQYATGHRTDLDAIGELCARRNVLFMVDGIQSVGAVEIDVRRSKIHFLSADSHKWMLGMPGIGFLYVSRDVIDRIRPVLVGWHSTTDAWNFDRAHFELRRDSVKLEEGSPAYTGIWGLGAAVELLLEIGVPTIEKRIAELTSLCDRFLVEHGCTTWPAARDRAGIVTFVPRDEDSRAVYERLCAADVSVSLRRGRIRVSPHVYTLDAEIEKVISISCRAKPS